VIKKPWPALTLAFVVFALAPLSAGASSSRPAGVVPALDYLHARQTADGSIGGGDLTPWAVLAISAARENPLRWQIGGKDPVLAYLQSLNLEQAANDTSNAVNQPEFYARAILAYVAAGRPDLANRSAGSARIDLCSKLLSYRDSGDGHFSPIATPPRTTASIETTIWAILALHAAGSNYNSYVSGDNGAVKWLEGQQDKTSGGFASEPGQGEDVVDTALAIQALRAGGDKTGSTFVTKAVAYLAARQRSDGGFGRRAGDTHSNAESTAAAIQGLIAAGQLPADGSTPAKWIKPGGATPYRCLRRLQLSSGVFQYRAGVTASALLTTAEAVIALSHKTFPFTRSSSMFSPAYLPHFKSVSPAQGAHFFSGSVTFKASYTDNAGGTGISTKLTTITVDGRSETAHASVISGSLILHRDDLAAGTHTFVIKLSDRAGNTQTVTRQFTVSGVATSHSPTSTYTSPPASPPASMSPTTTYTSPPPTGTASMSPTTYPSGSPSVTGVLMSPSPSTSASPSAAAAPSGGSGGGPSTGTYAGLALLAMLPIGASMSYLSYRRRLGLLADAGKGHSFGSPGTGWSRFKRRLFGVTGLSHLIRR
jgi:hypothetical protein